jgi:hypothetical protein
MDIFRTSIQFDPDRLRGDSTELRKRIPEAHYIDLPGRKRTGWAPTSPTGGFDDIHGRRHRAYENETEFVHPTPALQGYFRNSGTNSSDRSAGCASWSSADGAGSSPTTTATIS